MAGPWEQYQQQPAAGPWTQYADVAIDADPTKGMGTGQKVLAGMGSGMASVGRALGLGDVLERTLGLPATKEEADRLDKPLAATTAGKIGQVGGTVAPAALSAIIPGANTYLGATLIGAGMGGALTEGGLQDRAMGAAGGALGGPLGLAVGRGIGNAATWALGKRAAGQAADDAMIAGARTANEAGYVLPPNEIKRDLPNALANAWGGQIKTAQQAAYRNQQNTNKLAAEAVGLTEDAALTREVLDQVRKNAGVVYSEINALGQLRADKSYFRAIDSLKGIYEGAAKDFPELAKPEITNILNAIRKDEFSAKGAVDAIRILRADADAAFRRGDKGLAKALKGGAGALEDVIERNLSMRNAAVYEPAARAARPSGTNAIPEQFPGTAVSKDVRPAGPEVLTEVQAAGPNDLLQRFREARKLIAKTYDVEKALKGENVDASVLARRMQQGKPMTDELRTIAEVAAKYPKATQLLKETPHPYSMVDVGFTGIGGMLDPSLMLLSAARPVVRSAALSPQGQAFAATRAPSPVNGLLGVAAEKRLLPYYGTTGASLGLLGAQ